MPIHPGRKPNVWRIRIWANGRDYEEAFHGTKVDALEHEARMRLTLVANGRTRPERLELNQTAALSHTVPLVTDRTS
ncbi:MAG TPA: hypothetical protein VN894_05645 [Polyangiaceae bacterium]|nr:hypothetical protein [Polyangiaceae bacterium]